MSDIATDTLDLEQLFRGKGAPYVLRVRDDSMVGDHLYDGDYVVIDPGKEAANGNLAVVATSDGEATLRHYHRDGKNVVLKASNPAYADKTWPAHETSVRGVVIGVLRSYAERTAP